MVAVLHSLTKSVVDVAQAGEGATDVDAWASVTYVAVRSCKCVRVMTLTYCTMYPC